MNFETNSNISSVLTTLQSSNLSETNSYGTWPHFQYICRVVVNPFGRPLLNRVENGIITFWNIRARISKIRPSSSCSDSLLLQFRHKDNLVSTLEGYSEKTINITCKDSLPIVIPSDIRKLYITYFSSDSRDPGFFINVTSFIFFQGDFPHQYQMDMCRRESGFWCANETNVCIFHQLKCDGFDSCFDGGSDELDCVPTSWNSSKINPVDLRKATFIDYLPWLALGILPLILLMALVCICNQHRNEVFFDEEEDNLEIEKSQDDNADQVWSSLDGIDQLDKTHNCIEEEEEEGQDNADSDNHSLSHLGKEPLIGLQTKLCPATVKVDIAPNPPAYSSIKDYEDIDNATVRPTLENGLPASGDSKTINNVEEKETLQTQELLTSALIPNPMTVSEITDEDYVLEDVGSLLRKVDKSKIPEEVRISSIKSSMSNNENINNTQSDNALDYRSDYILV